VWASGYELYDRFSPTYQRFLEGLTATFIGDGFIKAEQAGRTVLYDQPRGSPKNVGKALTAVHPVVRTNPVTGWKSVFAVGTFPKTINELNPEESDELLAKFKRMIAESHDLQVRFKWRNQHDIGRVLRAWFDKYCCADSTTQLFGTIVLLSTARLLIMTGLVSGLATGRWALVRSHTWTRTVCREVRLWDSIEQVVSAKP
jgi:hypothetical protein